MFTDFKGRLIPGYIGGPESKYGRFPSPGKHPQLLLLSLKLTGFNCQAPCWICSLTPSLPFNRHLWFSEFWGQCSYQLKAGPEISTRPPKHIVLFNPIRCLSRSLDSCCLNRNQVDNTAPRQFPISVGYVWSYSERAWLLYLESGVHCFFLVDVSL